MIEIEKLKIEMVEFNEDVKYGKFVIELFECGYGIILGNFLCRIFLFLFFGVVVIVI